MPWLTSSLIEVSNFLADGPGWILLCLVVWAIIVLVGLSLAEIFTPYNRRRHPGRGIKDRLIWTCPLAHGLVRDRGLADVFDVLAEGLEAGRPLAEALPETQRLRLNKVLEQRLLRVAEAVERGMSLADAARLAGMPALVAGMVATGEASGTLAETCAFLARYYRARFSRTLILLQMAAEPVMVLTLGILVAIIVVALFMPLVTLIDSVSVYKGVL